LFDIVFCTFKYIVVYQFAGAWMIS
jgi:hypothetical protein